MYHNSVQKFWLPRTHTNVDHNRFTQYTRLDLEIIWILSAVWRNAANKLPTLILACNESLRCYYLCSCYRYNHTRDSGVETSNGSIFSFYIYLLICHWYKYFNQTIRTFELTSNNYEYGVFCFPCRSVPFHSFLFHSVQCNNHS